MIVDDEVDILTVFEKGLTREGLDVVAFSNPVEALQHFEKNKDNINLLITDARMPEMSGFQLARKVKNLKPETRIILISAFEINKEEFDKVLPSTHIDGFLTKPFHATQLVEVIRSLA